MITHSHISLALISFSMATSAAAIPTDADQTAPVAIQNTVLHKDVALYQGGGADKDVANRLGSVAPSTCSGADCINHAKSTIKDAKLQVANGRFLGQGSSSALQPVAVLLLIIGVIIFLLARKSSTK